MDAEYCGVRNLIGQHIDSINDFDVPLYKLIKNVEIIKWSQYYMNIKNGAAKTAP